MRQTEGQQIDKNSPRSMTGDTRQKIMRKIFSNISGRLTIETAKARLNIHDLWRHFGFEGKSKPSCCSPFRDDCKPSFSVNADGTLWHDFATGEGGDTVDFFQRATGLSQRDACRKFLQLAGGRIIPWARADRLFAQPQPAEAKPVPVFPQFNKGTAADIEQLADLRQVCREGLELARERGLLRFATLKGYPAWVVTDSARVNAQARRMDGQNWDHIDAKAWTLPRAWASWPIGINESLSLPVVALCEGGPDLLAACHLIYHECMEAQCSAVAMMGATLRIHADALPMFIGKSVRIFGHDDKAGRGSVERWADQLSSVGAEVDAFSFAGLQQVSGQPVKDLNDVLLMDAESFAQVERILPL